MGGVGSVGQLVNRWVKEARLALYGPDFLKVHRTGHAFSCTLLDPAWTTHA